MTDDQALYYLAAIIDGEGCIAADGARYAEITISNTDLSIVRCVVEVLEQLDIDCSVRIYEPTKPQHSPCYSIGIGGRKNFEFVLENVPLASEKKIQGLKRLVGSYKKPHAVPRPPRTARPPGW